MVTVMPNLSAGHMAALGHEDDRGIGADHVTFHPAGGWDEVDREYSNPCCGFR
jgi:hypothetical protein